MTASLSFWRAATAAGLALGLFIPGASLAGQRSWSPDGPDRPGETDAISASGQLMAWVLETADNQGLPFLIIDKVGAEVSAFDREGRLIGTAPVLLGLARGDISPAGIGDRPLSAITPGERITPAGRFMASMGENLGGKGILWIDYDAALSLHPVITTRAADRRLQRLASATAEDNRISYGCINVPGKFYDEIVEPAFSGTMAVVYILPEDQSLSDVFFLAGGISSPAEDEVGPPLGARALSSEAD